MYVSKSVYTSTHTKFTCAHARVCVYIAGGRGVVVPREMSVMERLSEGMVREKLS